MRIRTTGEVQRIKDHWESYEEEEKNQHSNYSDDEEAYGIDILADSVGEKDQSSSSSRRMKGIRLRWTSPGCNLQEE